MQRKKQKERREPRGLAAPTPDPRHPEAVLDTVARAAGIDVHKMSLTCTVLVEDGSGRVESETRQYRTYGAELDLLVDWLAGLDLARVVMESTGVFWKAVQRALAEAGVAVRSRSGLSTHVTSSAYPGARRMSPTASGWQRWRATVWSTRASWRRRNWRICGA